MQCLHTSKREPKVKTFTLTFFTNTLALPLSILTIILLQDLTLTVAPQPLLSTFTFLSKNRNCVFTREQKQCASSKAHCLLVMMLLTQNSCRGIFTFYDPRVCYQWEYLYHQSKGSGIFWVWYRMKVQVPQKLYTHKKAKTARFLGLYHYLINDLALLLLTTEELKYLT